MINLLSVFILSVCVPALSEKGYQSYQLLSASSIFVINYYHYYRLVLSMSRHKLDLTRSGSKFLINCAHDQIDFFRIPFLVRKLLKTLLVHILLPPYIQPSFHLHIRLYTVRYKQKSRNQAPALKAFNMITHIRAKQKATNQRQRNEPQWISIQLHIALKNIRDGVATVCTSKSIDQIILTATYVLVAWV